MSLIVEKVFVSHESQVREVIAALFPIKLLQFLQIGVAR